MPTVASCSIIPHSASDTVVQFQGLTILQVSQNQAAVVSDPQNQIFVVKVRQLPTTSGTLSYCIQNSGFVALAIEGTYDVLGIVDQTHLEHKVDDPVSGNILGWSVSS